MKCLNCDKDFEIKESRKQDRKKKFCGSSCANSYNNRNIRYKKLELKDTDVKKCNLCDKEKSVSSFYKRKGSVDGFRNDCKECLSYRTINHPNRKSSKNRYYQNNKEKVKKRVKKYTEENSDKIKEKKKIYQKRNRDKRNKYLNERYKTDVIYKLTINCRGIILKAFKRLGWKKNSKTQQLLGCSYQELKEHLEKQFKDGMTWENHGDWHIDHKTPLSWAKNEEELNSLCYYMNLQPLWASENMSKKNYYSN